MDKHEVAKLLEEIATLLEIQGENPFKVRAYLNAAREIESLDEDIDQIVKKDHLKDLPGIGEKIAGKITTFVTTGHLPYYDELKKCVPEGLLELLKIGGLGGKKVKALHEELGIKNIDDLEKACRTGKVAELPHFGEKTQDNILSSLEKLKSRGNGRILWWDAELLACPILESLRKLKGVQKAEIAGSVRRKLETIGDFDFLVASSTPAPIMNWFTKQPEVEKVLAKGPTKSSVILKEGIQADLRVIPKEQYGFALLYFTGSKAHNIKIRQRAHKLGYSLSEYGLEPLHEKKQLFSSKKEVTEADIYKALGLHYIPPELREDTGEIEAAEKGELPVLVEDKDIRGVFHCHTTDSDGHNTLEEMVAAAEAMGWEYFGIADHSKSSVQAHGMKEDRLFEQNEHIHHLNKSGKFSIHVFTGIECDILTNGDLDFPSSVLKELDYVVASVHRSFQLDEKTMTARIIKAIENPYTTMVGHPTGRLLLKREPYAVNMAKLIDACIANDKIIELNAHPMRLDMDWRLWHKAAEKGLKCCINPDAHSIKDLQYYRAGVNIARKGWLTKEGILNTLPLKKVKSYFQKK